MSQGQTDEQQQLEMLLSIMREQGGGVRTNMTKTVHRALYPAIDPKRPELSQKGRTILITGAGTGIGLTIAKSFTQADALRIIITGRRNDVLTDAKKEIQAEARQTGKTVEVLTRPFDVSDKADVAALWEELKQSSIDVDVLVLNAAKLSPAGGLGPLFGKNTTADIWDLYETNVHGLLLMAEAFDKQNVGKYKNIINISTQSIYQFSPGHNVISNLNPAYTLSKNAGTLVSQVIAEHADPNKTLVVSLHPGVVYSPAFENFGITPDMLPFDDISLPGAAAVYLASREAKFLQFIWAAWDVDELKTGELRKLLDENPEFLKLGVHGLSGDGSRRV